MSRHLIINIAFSRFPLSTICIIDPGHLNCTIKLLFHLLGFLYCFRTDQMNHCFPNSSHVGWFDWFSMIGEMIDVNPESPWSSPSLHDANCIITFFSVWQALLVLPSNSDSDSVSDTCILKTYGKKKFLNKKNKTEKK